MSHLVDSAVPAGAHAPERTWREWFMWLFVEDHCEWANRHVAWFRTPMGVLAVGALSALLCGVFVAPQGYAIFAAIMGVIVLGLVWPWIAMKGIHARLEFSASRGREGKETVADFVVVNRWPWPVWGLAVSDSLLTGGVESEAAGALARIEGWSRATFHCPLTPKQRGVYPKHEVRIGSGFPFGLYQSSRPVEVEKQLIVWPQTFWLPPLGDNRSRHDWRGEVSDALVGTQGARLGPREHRHGDTLRDVHWAKSAQHDRLIVSEREAATVEEHLVVADIDSASHSGSGPDSTLEWSLRAAASVCEALVGQRGTVTLLLGDQAVTAHTQGDDLRRLLDTIALLQPSDAPVNQRALRRHLSCCAISIGTEKSPVREGRFICFRSADHPGETTAGAWIDVDQSGDVAGQVLQGWRARAGRPRHAG